jgi:hypothetical protein
LPNPALHGLDLAIQAEQIPKILDAPAKSLLLQD